MLRNIDGYRRLKIIVFPSKFNLRGVDIGLDSFFKRFELAKHSDAQVVDLLKLFFVVLGKYHKFVF